MLISVALVVGAAACGESSDSRDRNVGVSLAGTTCTKLGQVQKKKGISYVCAGVKLKNSTSKAPGTLYGVAAVKNWRCAKLGVTRYLNGVFSVCSGGKSAKSRKWALTVGLPANVVALVDPSQSTQAGALEAIGITPPAELAGPIGNGLAGQQVASGDGTGAIVGTTTTSSLPEIFVVKQGQDDAPSTSVVTVETIPPTSNVSATTQTPTTEAEPTVTTNAPSTTEATTTESPTTTPQSTVPTTTTPPTTISATTVPPTTVPPTTVAPTTTLPKTLTCAEGGTCKPGDTGPGGGVVVLSNFNLSAPAFLIEVAPVTWYASYSRANAYAEGLVFGRKSDWRLPSVMELMAMRRDRAQFRCPGLKRCAKGFARGVYVAADERRGIEGVDFASISPSPVSVTGGSYVRPVRTIGLAGQQIISLNLTEA